MKLLKYSKINHHLIKNLLNKEIYFNSIANFDDPSDSQFSLVSRGKKKDLDVVAKRCEKYIKKNYSLQDPLNNQIYTVDRLEQTLQRDYELNILELFNLGEAIVRKEIGVCCFSKGKINPVMFSQYADEHRGVCLEFEVAEKYQSFFKEIIYEVKPKAFSIQETINYLLDKEGQIKLHSDSNLDLLCYKHRSWKYQNEYRLFRGGANAAEDMEKYGLTLKSIIFGCRTPNSDINLLLSLLNIEELDLYIFIKRNGNDSEYWGLMELEKS